MVKLEREREDVEEGEEDKEVEENEKEEEDEDEQHMSDEHLRLAPPREDVGEYEDDNEVEENDKEEEHVSDERLRPAPLYMMTGDCMMAEQQRGRLLCARTLPSQVFQCERAQDTCSMRAARSIPRAFWKVLSRTPE